MGFALDMVDSDDRTKVFSRKVLVRARVEDEAGDEGADQADQAANSMAAVDSAPKGDDEKDDAVCCSTCVCSARMASERIEIKPIAATLVSASRRADSDVASADATTEDPVTYTGLRAACSAARGGCLRAGDTACELAPSRRELLLALVAFSSATAAIADGISRGERAVDRVLRTCDGPSIAC